MNQNNLFAILVDDNEIDLFLHEKLLVMNNLATKVQKFASAHDALQFLQSTSAFPDYILLDIQMPELDGFEFLKRYEMIPEKKRLQCHIFMVSSSLDFGDISRAKANPLVSGFIKKPINVNELRDLMTRESIMVPLS